jgi:hypothetical protein
MERARDDARYFRQHLQYQKASINEKRQSEVSHQALPLLGTDGLTLIRTLRSNNDPARLLIKH